jgi:8-amino-7-oxononanoate synthase
MGDKWPYMKTVKANTERELSIAGKSINCISSYSYLDLSSDPEVTKAAIEAAKSYGTGNNGPRMLCGNLDIHEEFEKKLAKFLGKEHALVFSSGYLACMSVITGLARKGDVILMDKMCHNSL